MKFKVLLYLSLYASLLQAQQPLQVRELEKERLAIVAGIEETNRLLRENTRTTSNALNRLNLLIQTINSRKKIILLLNQEISSIDKDINTKEMQIKALEKDIEMKKQQYAASLRKMYLNKKNQNNMMFILSSQNFSQSFHRIMYLRAYSEWQKKQAEEIIDKQNTINQEKTLLLSNRSDKLKLLNDRQSEEKQLSKEEESRKAEIKTLERNKKALQEDLIKKQRQATALNRQLEKFISEEVTKSNKAVVSNSGENRTAEVKGGYAMTESERTLSSTFAGNKGKLPFPLKGNYKIVGYFGVHQHKELSKIVVNNNGIDIETTSGNEARAVFDGVVSRIFTLPGYNNSIIIRHGNYLTLYSNIDQVYVKQGDKVNTGQTLGKIYTDKDKGNSTLLHFEIWKEQTKLDPMAWIK